MQCCGIVSEGIELVKKMRAYLNLINGIQTLLDTPSLPNMEGRALEVTFIFKIVSVQLSVRVFRFFSEMYREQWTAIKSLGNKTQMA